MQKKKQKPPIGLQKGREVTQTKFTNGKNTLLDCHKCNNENALNLGVAAGFCTSMV